MSGLFDAGRQAFLEGSIAWLTDTIRAMLVDTAIDTPVLTSDANFSDISALARIGNSSGHTRADMPLLAGKTSTAGVANANTVTFLTVAAGSPLSTLVLFKDSGSDATSTLLALLNVGTGVPVTPNGGNITVAFDTGVNKIFRLG